MTESMGQWPKKIKQESIVLFTKEATKQLASSAVHHFREGGWNSIRENVVSKHMENLGIVPKFTKEDDPKLSEMRHRLNTEPGVVICNHPGAAETPIVLSALKREDLKVMVAAELYDSLPVDIAQKYFFSASTGPKSLKVTMSGIDAHIRSGGILFFYPQLSRHDSFQRAFREILQKTLKPQDMVYCFNVNTTDTKNLSGAYPWTGIGSELFLGSSANINKLRKPIIIRTDEQYTQAGEWQSAVAGVPKESEGLVLAEKYAEMFASNK